MSECLNKLKKKENFESSSGYSPILAKKGDEIKIKSGLQSQTATP